MTIESPITTEAVVAAREAFERFMAEDAWKVPYLVEHCKMIRVATSMLRDVVELNGGSISVQGVMQDVRVIEANTADDDDGIPIEDCLPVYKPIVDEAPEETLRRLHADP